MTPLLGSNPDLDAVKTDLACHAFFSSSRNGILRYALKCRTEFLCSRLLATGCSKVLASIVGARTVMFILLLTAVYYGAWTGDIRESYRFQNTAHHKVPTTCADWVLKVDPEMRLGIPGLALGMDRNKWLDEMLELQKACKVSGPDSAFADPKLAWTQRAYVTTEMHPWDRYFFDASSGQYTPDRYLDDLLQRFGGVDYILLWPTYPMLGVDERSAWDMFDALPGGRQALKAAIDILHARGVKVLVPYAPWDTGTNRSGLSDVETMHQLLKETGADGFNGDTLNYVESDFYKPGIAIEPEFMGNASMRGYHTMGWAYWKWGNDAGKWRWNWESWDPKVPMVDLWKWAADPRFMSHGCQRWTKDHTQFIQNAFFNAVGFVAFENVFGSWNGMRPRDSELLRRVAFLERYFGDKGLLDSGNWEPFTQRLEVGRRNPRDQFLQPVTYTYATRFSDVMGEISVFFIINRDDFKHKATLKALPDKCILNCYGGSSECVLEAEIHVEDGGIACLLEVPLTKHKEGLWPDWDEFTKNTASFGKSPLSSFSTDWKFLQQEMLSASGNVAAHKDSDWHWSWNWFQHWLDGGVPGEWLDKTPQGMVHIDGGYYFFMSAGEELEPNYLWSDKHGVDVQFPWESHPRRWHLKPLQVDSFFLDANLVTVSDYRAYLNATGYRPTDTKNWLRSWGTDMTPPPALLRTPVVHVSLGEARKYCEWAGKRLPHRYEWQYAAQNGNPLKPFPWGWQSPVEGQHVPTPLHGSTMPSPTKIGSFPEGSTWNGLNDMVGNVWQFTDEFQDEHNRYVLLVGASRYNANTPDNHFTNWYYRNFKPLWLHNKYFLMSDSLERASTIGFRCAADLTSRTHK